MLERVDDCAVVGVVEELDDVRLDLDVTMELLAILVLEPVVEELLPNEPVV